MSNLEWKTPKGTTLYLMLIKGKKYLPVAERMIWFREEHPEWGIKTTVVHTNDTETLAYAEIKNDNGHVIATAHKTETKSGFADHLEKSETGAIGRALAMCGYGTQFCGAEFDEGDRLADAPTGSVRLPIKTMAGIEAEHARDLHKSIQEDMVNAGKNTYVRPAGEKKKEPAFKVPDKFASLVHSEAGEYVAQVGQVGGKILLHKIKDIKPNDLMDFMKWLRAGPNKGASQDYLRQSLVQEFIAKAEEYINDQNGKS